MILNACHCDAIRCFSKAAVHVTGSGGAVAMAEQPVRGNPKRVPSRSVFVREKKDLKPWKKVQERADGISMIDDLERYRTTDDRLPNVKLSLSTWKPAGKL